MTRLLLLLVVLVILSVGAVWLGNQSGDLTIVWPGYEIRTSFAAGAGLVVLVVLTGVLVCLVLSALVKLPGGLALSLKGRRRKQGYQALSKGMIAVAAGDVAEAQRQAVRAQKWLDEPSLPLLLSAQVAQLEGKQNAAGLCFTAMLESPETEGLGRRGLFVLARREGDMHAALGHARAVFRTNPGSAWAATAVFELEAAQGAWTSAAATLDRMVGARLMDRETARRRRAVILTARARDLVARSRGDVLNPVTPNKEAMALALEAVELAPTFAPTVSLAARLCGASGHVRKGARLVERAWTQTPHPELAEAYTALYRKESIHKRFQYMKTLVSFCPGPDEARLALARAAVLALDWETARSALNALAHKTPSRQVCGMMAEIEEGQFGSRGKARYWLGRALNAPPDAAWVSPGMVSSQWLPVCPKTHGFDVFVWQKVDEGLRQIEGHRAAPPASGDVSRADVAFPAHTGGYRGNRNVKTDDSFKRPSVTDSVWIPPVMRKNRGGEKIPAFTPNGVTVPVVPDDPGPEDETGIRKE